MRNLLALVLFVVAAQASQLIPRDVVVPTNPRLTGQEWQRVMAAQKPQPENYPHYKRGSVPQSPLAGRTFADIETRIILGSDAKRGQFPWQAGVIMDSRGYCGGSIISEWWILTAGHCVAGMNVFELILGANNIQNPEVGSFRVKTTYKVLHDLYRPMPEINYDVALLKVPKSIKFSTYMAPVRLPAYSFTPSLAGVDLRVSGWGRTIDADNTSGSKTLQFTNVIGIFNQRCADEFGGVVTNRNICTMGTAGNSPCNGDDGGALVYQQNDGRYAQVGIVSFGAENRCSFAPAAYSRVTSFLQWIESKTDILIDQ